MRPYMLALLASAAVSLTQVSSAQATTHHIPDEVASISPETILDSGSLYGPQSPDLSRASFQYHVRLDLAGLQPPAAAKAQKPQIIRIRRTAIHPSMVGYIEDSGVHTEVRIRFDAALHDVAPDRAEFFYAKCGCYRAGNDKNAPGPGDTAFPSYVNFQQLYFLGEYAVKPRLSFSAQVPLRWLQPHSAPGVLPAFANSGGIGDVQLGMKLGVIASPSTSLTFMLRGTLPSGDSRRGLGTAHGTFEPALLMYQRLSSRLSAEGQVGDSHPIGGALGITIPGPRFAGDVFYYGLGSSYKLIDDEAFRLAPVVEFVGWHMLGGQVTNNQPPDGVNIVNAKMGPRMSFGAHSSLYVGYGIALTSQNWYHEIFRTEYRYAF